MATRDLPTRFIGQNIQELSSSKESYMYDSDLNNNKASATPETVPSALVSKACVGNNYLQQVNIALTGTPNWTIEYTYNGQAYTESGITSSPFIFTPTKSGTFYVTSVTDGNGNTIDYPTAPYPVDMNAQVFVFACYVPVNPMLQQRTNNN